MPDSGDVFFVPALAGLAAPYWDSAARGTILGLTRGTTRAHIVRAALEGVAFRTRDVLEAMMQDIGHPIQSIKADGSASANGFLMQTLANVSNCEVHVAALHHTTALGIGLMTGMAINLWADTAELTQLVQHDLVYVPHHSDEMDRQYRRWLLAVERSRDWAKPTL